MKMYFDDCLEALKDADYPIAILLAQHRRDGFGSDELSPLDFRILYAIQDELQRMIDRIGMAKWRKEKEMME